ncbi:unnamed protein product [Rhizoctonia solani]|uniref:60S acidic ribosomal protein P1 n=1 Tax=Rhizoctonia solani TaxID=456999 RepID=A0A8H2WFV1_9AGAM|nr:unnamed protein product [Rhizoctonia solani]
MASTELAATYAALILADDGVEITSLSGRHCLPRRLKERIAAAPAEEKKEEKKEEEKEESDEDMGFGLFD